MATIQPPVCHFVNCHLNGMLKENTVLGLSDSHGGHSCNRVEGKAIRLPSSTGGDTVSITPIYGFVKGA